ncbi:MAG: enoyl-CoA hydratase/isomerase family protein [Phenylobacterium sp.]|uniref:enoyl-CoA hydratase/isomerase family protein n=1 Tax=Phenylobacterium sp. TaxID=1871053 RepID=UPI002735C3AA|nr:enoyl-CoA hydratase/isomerase family protein [Phenylobacterium sp.]MDP3173848.1 enoyl-CoA hydratase/isomerase family protein [Phenylobacterium sp.]
MTAFTKHPEDVIYGVKDGVATISINRPQARNSLRYGTASAIYDAALEASKDPSVRVVVLRGEGADFCAGADIKQYNSEASGQPQYLAQDRTYFHLPVLLHEMAPVTIAAVRGACAGAGFGWALGCDLRFADTRAAFNTAFLAVGAAGDMAGPWTLSRIVGAGRARDLYFFPRKFGAQEALDMGMVTRVFDEASFETELDKLTAQLANSAPLALKALKANFLDAERMDMRAFSLAETERHAQIFPTRDRAEAFAAFAEKRPAKFEGR